MRFKYQIMLLALAFGAMLWPAQQARAQGDTLYVEWADAGGNPIRNALRDAIANDTDRPAGRVYKLHRGGFYWIEDRIQYSDFHLRIVGETAEEADVSENVCGAAGNEDCGPAIIQRVRRADQSIEGVMIQNSGGNADLTLQNLWIMGQDDVGTLTTYEPLALDATDSRFTFDNVIFDRNNWHHIGVNGTNNDVFITNSSFRNLFGPTQQWEGLGIRLEVGADSVVIENNTFLNIGFTPFQSEAAPANYLRFNHNTMVNIGRAIQAGSIWKEAYFTNNLVVNGYWHGNGAADLAGADEDADPFAGFFSIGALPAIYGTNLDRRIVFANTSYWRDPAFAAYYADSIRAQPLVNDTTMGYFRAFPDNMKFQNNFVDVNPGLATYPDNIPQLIQNIRDLRAGVIPAATYFWDPGRDEACFQCNVWPLPENFAYTNAQLQSGGTDGLPLGDLNWFPAAKATFEANKAQYVAQIEAMAQALDIDVVSTVEAEQGTLEGSATVAPAEGFTYFFMEGGGFIEWAFDLPEAGTYDLKLHTNLRSETQRGQRIRVNGVNLRNNSGFGEYYFCTAAQAGCALPLAQNAWVTVDITAAGLVEGAEGLTMPAGPNTIRIEPSWGWQAFSGVDVVDAGGNVVASLTAPQASYSLVHPICEDADFCPSGFNAVALDGPGSVSINVDAPANGQYMLRVFYNAPAAASARVLANGNEVLASVPIGEGAGDIITQQFTLAKGANTITLATDMGGFQVDYIQLLGVNLVVAREDLGLPEGYALEQNFPNPFNPTTTIQFELPAVSDVTLKVYDVLGREVMTLLDGPAPAGVHRVRFDGAGLASGVYLYRLQTPVGQQVRTMVLMK